MTWPILGAFSSLWLSTFSRMSDSSSDLVVHCSISNMCSRSLQLLHQNATDLQMLMLYLGRMRITLDQEPIFNHLFYHVIHVLCVLKESQWWQFLFMVLVLDLCILLPRNHACRRCSTSQFLHVNCCLYRIKTRQCMSQLFILRIPMLYYIQFMIIPFNLCSQQDCSQCYLVLCHIQKTG